MKAEAEAKGTRHPPPLAQLPGELRRDGAPKRQSRGGGQKAEADSRRLAQGKRSIIGFV